jgi:hypothetical protein
MKQCPFRFGLHFSGCIWEECLSFNQVTEYVDARSTLPDSSPQYIIESRCAAMGNVIIDRARTNLNKERTDNES